MITDFGSLGITFRCTTSAVSGLNSVKYIISDPNSLKYTNSKIRILQTTLVMLK